MKSHTFDTLGRTECTWWGLPLGVSAHRYRIYIDAKREDWSTIWLLSLPGGLCVGGRPPKFLMDLFKIEGHPVSGWNLMKLPSDEFLKMVDALNYREGSK